MSGGMEDSRRAERDLARVEEAAERLADELISVRDAVIGLPAWALDVVDQALERAGLRVDRRGGR